MITTPAAGIAFVRPSDGTTLLARRAAWLDSHPNVWAHVGGRVEPGETTLEAAYREAEEELGLPKGYCQQHGKLLASLGRNRFILYIVAVGPKALQRLRLNNENTMAAWIPLVEPSLVGRFLPRGDRLHPTTKTSWRTIADVVLGGYVQLR